MERMTASRDQETAFAPAHRDALACWHDDREAWQTQQPATAFLADSLTIEAAEASRVATATTDGTRLLVNPDWSATLDASTRRFVQAHLVWHCAAGHFRPVSADDERRWHLACDHHVNTQLLLLGFDLPPTAVLFPALIGRSLVQVHEALADNPLIPHEESLDTSPWHTSMRADGSRSTPLREHWKQRCFRLVRAHLGGPELPAPVAAWLIGQWAA